MSHFLHALAAALEPFHRLDPAGWFAWRSQLPGAAALAFIAVGALCLAVGAHEKLFRFVACPLGILIGVALTEPVLKLVSGTSVPAGAVELALPLVLGIASAIVPQTIAFCALGAVGALVGAAVVSEHELLIGALPGFFVAGTLGIVLSRVADTLSAAAFGAMLLVGGALAAFGSGPLKVLTASVWLAPILAAVLTAVGAGLQFAMWADPDARAEKKAQAADARTRAKEDKAREKRFANYGKG